MKIAIKDKRGFYQPCTLKQVVNAHPEIVQDIIPIRFILNVYLNAIPEMEKNSQTEHFHIIELVEIRFGQEEIRANISPEKITKAQ